jgi:ribonuclease VapC
VIVDTSALVAIAGGEANSEALSDAIFQEGGRLPAPAMTEFHRVVTRKGSQSNPRAMDALAFLMENGLSCEPFGPEDVDIAALANIEFGQGNGRGGRLNLLDLMVYAMARRMDLPILCTGRDFSSTDAKIHPASRTQ